MTPSEKIPNLHAAILIGGRSRRMGTPKSMLRRGECFILEQIAEAVASRVSKIFIIGDAPLPPAMEKFPKLSDVPDIAGPAAGILAALQHAPDAWWLVVSCDLPLISAEAVAWIIEHADLRAPAVLPHIESPQATEPLFALYAPTARAVIERAAMSGDVSLRRMFSRVRIASPQIPPHLREAWTNVNTPEEWQAITARGENE